MSDSEAKRSRRFHLDKSVNIGQGGQSINSTIGTSDIKVYNESSIRHNGSVVEYCRTTTSVFSGMGAGILGLTNFYGFAFYFIAIIGLWLILIAKAGTNYQSYFPSRRAILTNGFFGSLFTYILCWTFAYGIVHVY